MGHRSKKRVKKKLKYGNNLVYMYDYANNSLGELFGIIYKNLPNCKKYYRVFKS